MSASIVIRPIQPTLTIGGIAQQGPRGADSGHTHGSIAALRGDATVVGGSGGSVVTTVLRGYTSGGDGGGGPFMFDPLSMALDDIGTVVRPTHIDVSSPGRWLRLRNRGEYRPEWFGALGTSDDTTALRAAMAAALADPAGVLFISANRTHIVSGRNGALNAILTLGTGAVIAGQGYSSCIKVKDSQTGGGDYFVFSPETAGTATNNILLTNFRIDGNGLNNLVLGSSGGNIRRALAVNVDNGSNIRIKDMWFENHPGRNVIVLGNNTSPPSVNDAWVTDCRFKDVGGAISGNELQNDHSTIYSQCDRAFIQRNIFENSSVVNPTSVASHVVTALEVHGSHTVVAHNHIKNFTHGGNAVAASHDSKGNIWHDNTFENLTKLGMSLWSLSPYHVSDLRIHDNTFHMYGQLASEIGVIFQSVASSNTTTAIEGLSVRGNTLYTDDTTSRATIWHAIQLCAVDGGDVRGNRIRNIQGNGVYLADCDTAIGINDLVIEDNDIKNVGVSTLLTRVWAIHLQNTDTGITWERIRIRRNQIRNDASNTSMRGIRLEGPGIIRTVTIDGENRFYNIANLTQLIDQTSSTNFRGISILPRHHAWASTADPTRGIWVVGQDVIDHTDPTDGNVRGKVVLTSGGAYEATWVAATAYVVGQWIKTSAGKVLECSVAGTSHASVEPAPTTLGATASDGTVTWIYRASAIAVFEAFGVIGTTDVIGTFPDGSTTPSVQGGVVWQCGNTGATSITNFTNGYNGKEIVVRIDSNTTIVHNTSFIRLKGSVNLTGNSNTVVTLRRMASIWFETARNI